MCSCRHLLLGNDHRSKYPQCFCKLVLVHSVCPAAISTAAEKHDSGPFPTGKPSTRVSLNLTWPVDVRTRVCFCVGTYTSMQSSSQVCSQDWYNHTGFSSSRNSQNSNPEFNQQKVLATTPPQHRKLTFFCYRWSLFIVKKCKSIRQEINYDLGNFWHLNVINLA